MSSPEANKKAKPRRRSSLVRWVVRIAVIAIAIYLGVHFMGGKKEAVSSGTTFAARRGPLNITVTEGGNIDSSESQEIKSEVEGQTKILSIVEEGYMVTQEDIDNGKLLVELDATELLERQMNQELEYQNSLAALTEAREAYEIQLNQNRSDITAAELDTKFARMDFEKYLGASAASELLTKIDAENAQTIEQDAQDNEKKRGTQSTQPSKAAPAETLPDESQAPEASQSQPAPMTGPAPAASTESTANPERVSSTAPEVSEGAPAPETPAPSDAPTDETPLAPISLLVDFSQYADIATLGDGEAGQKLRKLEDDFVLSKKELGLSETQFEGTQRLAEKEFVTKTEVENEQLKVERNQIGLQSAETSKELFIKYEFPKQAEKLLSDYRESLRKLERAKKLAISKLAQAEAQLKSSEARYSLQSQKREKLQDQIGKCKIKATRTGLVVYGGGDRRYWGGDEEIKEGTIIRERQEILTIPDLTRMCVKVKIHESAIKQIAKGQKAKITIDAFPDEVLAGEVVKVGVLPDSQNRWMNPDVKVYEVEVSIVGSHDWLKPGLTAQVEIMVKEIPDILYVPIQAVVPSNGDRVCYLARTIGDPERRIVQTGEFNNEFIQIKDGIKEGDVVLLRAPTSPEEAEQTKEGEKKEDEREKKGKRRERNGEARPERPAAPSERAPSEPQG